MPFYSLSENPHHYNIVAVYIPNNNPDKVRYITDVTAHLATSFIKKVEDGLFRMHLYTVDTITGKPDKELLFDNKVYVSATQAKKNFIADISTFNIQFPENGVFAGIEWLTAGERFFSTNPALRFTTKISQHRTYYYLPTRNKLVNVLHNDGWDILPSLFNEKEKIFNVCVGIKVSE